MVVNHQHARLLRMKDQRRAGDVTGTKLLRRKRLRRVKEQMIHQVLTLRSHPIVGSVESHYGEHRFAFGDRHADLGSPRP